MDEPVYCIRHPQRETGLRCARCGDPICPACMVQGAVGHLCPSCVTWERNPVGTVSTGHILLAVAAGMGVAIVLAIAIAVLSQLLGGFFSLIMWAAAGSIIGQVVHIAANRSRAPQLRFAAGGAAAFSWAVALLIGGAITLSIMWIVFAILQLAIVVALSLAPFR